MFFKMFQTHDNFLDPRPATRADYIISFDSRSRYPAVNGLYVHNLLCLSLQTAYPLCLSVCPLSSGVSKLIQGLE